jgi:hypothetical protein
MLDFKENHSSVDLFRDMTIGDFVPRQYRNGEQLAFPAGLQQVLRCSAGFAGPPINPTNPSGGSKHGHANNMDYQPSVHDSSSQYYGEILEQVQLIIARKR